jgi:hypothetical protein
MNVTVSTPKYFSICSIEIFPIELYKEKGNEFFMTYVKILRWKIINSNKGFLEAYNSTSPFFYVSGSTCGRLYQRKEGSIS